MLSVFEARDYKSYLVERLPTSGDGRGLRSKLAKKLRCQTAHISQVLNGNGHFSLENAAMIDVFLEHGPQESEYFMLLVHLARSGNRVLSETYKRRMEKILDGRQHAAIQAPPEIIDDVAMMQYYSSWHFAAIHILLMSASQTLESMAARLGLSVGIVKATVAALQRMGLVHEVDGSLSATPSRWHLSANSPLVARHHVNWRLKTIQNLEQRSAERNLHYSGPMIVAKSSAVKIRARLIKCIEELEPLIAVEGNEEAMVVCLDLFNL